MKKVLLILVAVIGFGIVANAQDIIMKKDGSEIKAKVLEITEQQIKYKLFDFQSGPIRNINTTEVFLIIYENGQREVFAKIESKEQPIEEKEHTTEPKKQPTQPQQQEYQNYQSTSNQSTNENSSANTNFVLKKKSKIMINTFVLLKSQSNTLCDALEEEFNKLGFCCVSKMKVEDDPTADVIIFVHATPASITFNFYDKALDMEIFRKTYLFQLSLKGIAKKLVKEIYPIIEK
jgi:hypothetical protein